MTLSALDRSFWLAVAVITYIGTAGIQLDGIAAVRILAVTGQFALLAWVWAVSKHRREAASEANGAAPGALRLGAAGVALWATARLGPSQAVELELAATAGVACSTCAALFALARVPYGEGLLRPPQEVLAGRTGQRSRLSKPGSPPPAEHPEGVFQKLFRPGHATRSLDATVLAGLLWAVVWAIALVRFGPAGAFALDPLALDYAGATASIASLLLLLAATWRLRALRKLELGTGDRALGALALVVTALSVALPVAVMDLAPPDRVLPAAVLVACLCVLWTLLVEDAQKIAAALRTTMVLTAVGLPLALLSGALATQNPGHAGAITLGGSTLCLLAGIIAREASRPLAPEQTRWLQAIAHAQTEALVPEPRPAIIATLGALKRTSTSPQARPELYMLNPGRVQTVDVAGYLHEEPASAPQALYELGLLEPERTLRAEVLAELRVKKPSVRPLLDWFDVRRAFSATIICDAEGPLGFLLLPRGDRTAPLTLEEAKSLRALADRLSGLLAVTSALERARVRQYAAEDTSAEWERAHQVISQQLQGQAGRNREYATLLARPLLDNAFSPAVRLALRALQQETPPQRARLLLSPLGVSVEPWGAALHLARKTRLGALLVLDGAFETENRVRLWAEGELSPLVLASGGTLLVKNLELASVGVQELLTETILQGRTEAIARPAEIVLSVSTPPAWLVQHGKLQPSLAMLLDDPIVLPTLTERPEDLRSVIISTLARSPYQGEKGPLGIERYALQTLLDHDWPGNDAELQDRLARAAAATTGPQLTFETLMAQGFQEPLPVPPPQGDGPRFSSVGGGALSTNAPAPHRRRAKRRPPRRGR